MERSPLREGDEVDEALAEALAQETFTLAATEKAVQYLARREHSREELRRKLLRKEYPQAAVEGALDACERRGYLDDERFARLWTESRIRRRPDGPKKVEAALLSKGVSREIAERVVAELFTEEVIEETLRRAAQKGRRRAGDDPLRLKNYLLSRGFTAPLINKYIR
jgi:regulatory protein